jgi:predicted  nucleic acid-binding Zn-ribbon protein
MSPDLERLIRLQAIETQTFQAHKRIADAPGEIAALDAKLTAARDAVAKAKQATTDNQSARRSIEKDLAAVQQRLSKYKEQLMEVKTNAEYHAMQHQISAANDEVAKHEERILVTMLDADEIATSLKSAEATLKADEAAVAKERATIEADVRNSRQVLDESAKARDALLPTISRAHLDLFERVFKARQGIAVAVAVDGHCSICHVRLRPQVYNIILRNDDVVQCDHCQRVLYFEGVPQRSAAGQAVIDAAVARQSDHDSAS